MKFKVRDNPSRVKDAQDSLACVGLVKRSERLELLAQLREVSIEPEESREVAVLLQTRRRCYISRLGHPFATITLDHVAGRSWLYTASFDEMELEPNEIAYTDADESARSKMTTLNKKMKEDLFSRFPNSSRTRLPNTTKRSPFWSKGSLSSDFLKLGLPTGDFPPPAAPCSWFLRVQTGTPDEE